VVSSVKFIYKGQMEPAFAGRQVRMQEHLYVLVASFAMLISMGFLNDCEVFFAVVFLRSLTYFSPLRVFLR